jgi:hypothetical protein
MNKAIELGTKAETLRGLEKAGFNVPGVYLFTTREWRNKKENVLAEIREFFISQSEIVVVRSSCQKEDQAKSSMAGAFESVLDIPLNDTEQIIKAVEKVIQSYGDSLAEEQVLVQPMLKDIVMSGVVMTRCMADGAPYYTINYDDETGRTDSVTGGGKASKTVYVYRGFRNSDFDSSRLLNLCRLMRLIEKFFGCTALDIEFGMDSLENIHIFQVRAIARECEWEDGIEEEITDKLSYLEEYLENFFLRKQGVCGKTSILGIMPDWNPAEIIGVTPRPLAASLYRFIVTERVWSLAREMMGYRRMYSEELMILLAGRPYIDVRNSFNSFLPEELPDELSEKIVNASLEYLSEHPDLHDKVEFTVIPTVYDFSFEKIFQERYRGLFNYEEFEIVKEAYISLTNRNLSIKPESSLLRALEDIQHLRLQQKKTVANPLATLHIQRKIKELLEESKVLGTLPFSIIARHAFIAESFLRSAVAEGALKSERLDAFKQSIRTISGEFSVDYQKVCSGTLSREEFMQVYGHLRPGTYDILSPCYSEHSEELFMNIKAFHREKQEPFQLSQDEQSGIQKLLEENGIVSVKAAELFIYAEKAIAGREYGKFVFTKNLSMALEELANWGKHYGLSRKDLSWLTIDEILQTLTAPIFSDPREYYGKRIQLNRSVYKTGGHLKLGHLIRSPRDIYVAAQHRSTPNFVTEKFIEGPVVVLGVNSSGSVNLSGAIVCIESADPGYDWIFSQEIKGLITKYGGTNSHMTIRCAEYELPAAIGCGEVLYEKIISHSECELDAGHKILRPKEVWK